MLSLKSDVHSSLSKNGLGNLLVVYIIWSSTYLAIRIMVTPGSGFSIWTAGSFRMMLAGLILLLFAATMRYRIKITFKELLFLFVTGNIFWFGCNGLVMWTEQRANSGFVALVLASTPIWSSFIESMLNRQVPSRLQIGSLLISFSGIIVMVAPSLIQGENTELGAGLLIILAAISNAIGSVIQARVKIKLEATVVVAYQHLLSGVGYIIIAVLSGQTWPQATPSAWLALAYLIIFGSVIACTSFIKTLKLLPISIAMTYAYVNPVLALILGWWLLNEALTVWTFLGAALVIIGIVGIFRDKEKISISEEKYRPEIN